MSPSDSLAAGRSRRAGPPSPFPKRVRVSFVDSDATDTESSGDEDKRARRRVRLIDHGLCNGAGWHEHGGDPERVRRRGGVPPAGEAGVAEAAMDGRMGSCCLLGAISGDTLYVANLGDSRAVLGHRVTGGGVAIAERLLSDHNAALEEVRQELTTLNSDDAQIMVRTRGAWRVKGIIQVCGTLHLLGFHHETSDEAAAEMEKEEQVILKSLRWKGKYFAKNAQDSSKLHTDSLDGQVTRACSLRFYRPKFKYIFLDMDGTLLNSKSQVTARNVEALREARSRGVNIVFATGKARPAVIDALSMVGLSERNGIVSESSPGVFL